MEESLEHLRVLKNKQTATLSAVTKKRNDLSRIMTSEDMLHLVKSGFDEFNQLCNDYEYAYTSHCDAIIASEDPETEDTLDQEYKRFCDRQNSMLEYKKHVMSWIAHAENIVSDNLDRQSSVGTSKSKSSRRSRRSTSSSTLTAKSREKARIAELLVEKSMLHRKQEIHTQEQELKIDIEIAKAQARDLVYENVQYKHKTIDANVAIVSNVSTPTNLSPTLPLMTTSPEQVAESTTVHSAIASNVVPPLGAIPSEAGVVFPSDPSVNTYAVTFPPTSAVAPPTQQNVSTTTVPTVLPNASFTTHLGTTSTSPLSMFPVFTSVTTPPVTSGISTTQHSHVHVPSRSSWQQMNPNAATFQPLNTGVYGQPHSSTVSTNVQQQQTAMQQNQTQQLIEIQNQLATAMTLPQPEVPKFKGESIEYNTFIMAFDARIASRVINNSDRLYYLDQHLEGEPKDLIGGCLYMNPDQGYPAARSLLLKEYGDPFKISTAYVNKVLSWPFVKHDDSAGLRRLGVFLIKCNNVMTSMSHMTILNHSPNMQIIVQKLPTYLQNKWREHVMKLRKYDHRTVNFHDLVTFVDLAAESANDPIYGKEALSRSDHYDKLHVTKDKQPTNRPRSTSFATNVYSSSGDSVMSSNTYPTSGVHTTNRFRQKCSFCSNSHDLDDCRKFAGKTIEDKRAFLMEKRMCFGCYGTNHISKGCTKKRTCIKCGKRHPSALHIENFTLNRHNDNGKPNTHSSNQTVDVPQNVTASSCLTTDSMDTVVLHAILPVSVHQKGSSKVVNTYAFYDNGSSGCFITEELKDDLNASGTETLLQLRTMHGQNYVNTTAIQNLIVSDLNNQNAVDLPKTYTRNEIPVNHQQIPRPEILSQWQHLREVAHQIHPHMPDLNIGLLIGSNCPAALEPLKVIPTGGDGPFATLLHHGWTINGPLQVNIKPGANEMTCNRIIIQEVEFAKEVIVPTTLLRMFELDFSEYKKGKLPDELGYSQEDLKFLDKAKKGIRLVNDHYELPLPFRDADVRMPNNRIQARNRANWQRKKMLRNETYRDHYTTFVNNLISKGYACKVPDAELDGTIGKVWYLSHHGVYHPKHPNKIRVVFDASASYEGMSLNDQLLQGPDLTNSLVGVLSRFREESVAFIGDIEAMFYQVKVPPTQHDFLRFLWWSNDDLSHEPEEYRMTVHLFGAVSSPSIANFVLKKIADEVEGTHGHQVANTIRRNFYVDDCLKSVCDEDSATQLIKDVTSACASGGFHLTKFTCNNSKVISSVPIEECSRHVQACDLDYDDLPIERALGIQWCAKTDTFGFSILLRAKPITRRGILSTISSIYDPLGFIAPFILPAKKLLQELCRDAGLGWDDEVSDEHQSQWMKWLNELPALKQISIKRCLKPAGFGHLASKQIHVFADASSTGYGAVAYLRLCDTSNKVHCAFLMGKSRLAPIKTTTIPRLELTSATVSVRLGRQLLQELSMEPNDIMYHTDSTTVLHYINSEKRRFPVFVSNRIQLIRDYSDTSQWKYVGTNENPADDASRGLSGLQIVTSKRWLEGPAFLMKQEAHWPQQPQVFSRNEEVNELVDTNATFVDESAATINTLIEHYSDWSRVRKAVAIFRRVQKILQQRILQRLNRINASHTDPDTVCSFKQPFSVQELLEAEVAILKYVQHQQFFQEIKSLQHPNKTSSQRGRVTNKVRKHSSVYRLDPYLSKGLLRVGGRLNNADLSDETKHPILLPHKCHTTLLIIRHIHTKLAHAGRNHVLSELRERYWITRANATVRHVISSCVTCRRLRMPVGHQKMANLPVDRLSPAPAFTYTGVDYFGPFLVKEGRKQLKRYGALFTCLVSRAVHIETANSLETDSFIHALRRFIAHRGPVREIRSDNGTNFVGAERELFQALNHDHIRAQMLKKNVDWKFNPPAASHMGGVWERQIRTVRKVLSQLLHEFADRLDDESFRTLLCEVECIVNSRPLTFVSSDPDDMHPLTPNHLLTMKTSVVMPPPGEFQRNDVYMKRRWRKVQYLANLFWSRWKREYLLTLQERQKWNQPKRNLQVGDIVIVKDDNTARNSWTMGRIVSTEPDQNGFVRSVMLKTQSSELRRPVTKLVLLLSVEEQNYDYTH